MRILFICAELPTRQHVRAYGLLGALAGRGHRVTLVCGAAPGDERGATELRERGVQTIVVPQSAAERRLNTLRALAGPLPLRAAGAAGRRLAAAIYREARSGRYDVAHLDGLAASGLGYALVGVPAVLDAGDETSQALEQRARGGRAGLGAAMELARTRRHEAGYLASYERVIAASLEAVWALRTLAADASQSPAIHLIPTPVETAPGGSLLSLREQEALLLCASAAGRRAALERVAAEAMPLIWAERPAARLLVPGPLSARQARGATDPRILGVSKGDARAIARATIALAPGDMRDASAALEALGAGTPLVASRAVGRALGASDGSDLLLADSPAELARAVLQLLDDPRYRGQVGWGGRAYAGRRHSPAVVVDELERVYAAAGGASIAGWSLSVGLGGLINRELGA